MSVQRGPGPEPGPGDQRGPDPAVPCEDSSAVDRSTDGGRRLNEPILPIGVDDQDIGWGDDLAGAQAQASAERWYQEQRPPHWE